MTIALSHSPCGPLTVPAFRPDGTVMDLVNLSPEDIDFAEMADRLSRIPRWCGRVAPGEVHPITIAQHSVMGAEALQARFGDKRLSGAFLLHDGHEYLIGDIITPTARLIAESAGPDHRTIVSEAVACAKRTIDRAIFTAAGMPDWLDLYVLDQKRVAAMDRQMMLAEGVALFGAGAAKHLPQVPKGTTLPKEVMQGWGPEKARERFRTRLWDYLGIELRRAR